MPGDFTQKPEQNTYNPSAMSCGNGGRERLARPTVFPSAETLSMLNALMLADFRVSSHKHVQNADSGVD